MVAPLVSVVLSVRNGEADLPKAIDSILTQTFVDLEMIAIDNGSTDGTAAVLDRLTDPRVRVVHQDDRGLPAALNRGISLARGRYIARQDCDDWARPSRLEKQVAFMEQHLDCALLGTRAEIWVGDQPSDRVHDHPTDDAALRFELLFDNPFVHSSVMIRRSALDDVGGYATDPARQPPEDYELWSRLARRHRVANLPERLTIYREVPKSMSRTGVNPFRDRLIRIAAENLAAAANVQPDDRHRDIAALFHGARGMVSKDPDIEGMCRIIAEAGVRIHAEAPDSDVPNRVATRVDMLRRLYADRRLGLRRLTWVVMLGRRSSMLRKLERRLMPRSGG
jgi:glycosyltransferase involved in cell wall biosynthesis